MKSISRLVAIGVTILSVQSFAQSALVKPLEVSRIHRGGNGGNGVAADFSMVALNILTVWKIICSNQTQESYQCKYIKDFSQMLDKSSPLYTTIHAQEKIMAYDGAERDAVNNGVDRITVSKSSWNSTVELDSTKAKIRLLKLVAHEYFSIIGLDSSDYYQSSNQLIGVILRKGFLPRVMISTEGMPDNCTINIKDDVKLSSSHKRNLRNKDFHLNSIGEKSRYGLKIKRKCEDKSLEKNCSIYIEQIDNFKSQVIFAEIFLDSYNLTGLQKAKNRITQKAISALESCRM